jgi:Na+(H+)/acetate symporter ActP
MMVVATYTPWDSAALEGMASYIKQVIGVSVNVGIFIMGVIVAILVVIKIAKRFAK